MNAHVWALPYLKYVRCWVNLAASLHHGIVLMVGVVLFLQAPRAGDAIGKQQKVTSADSFHRAALSDMAAKLNQRLDVRPPLLT